MPDPAFPFTLPFLAAKDVGDGPGLGRGRGGAPDQDDEGDEGGGGPQGGGGGGKNPSLQDPGGYYETNIFGGRIWHSTNGGPDLHGDAAQLEASKWLDSVDPPEGGDPSAGGGDPGRGTGSPGPGRGR